MIKRAGLLPLGFIGRALLSVRNYMKTFQPHQVTRFHGHFRVDEQNHFDKDPKAVQAFVKEEQAFYKEESSKWKHITEEYYKISSSRRDSRLSSVPERYDEYEYFTKTNWKNGRDYITVHRKRSNAQQELVLDMMAYPYISRYHQTAELLSTSFSPDHSLIAFSVDLKNNQKSIYFIAKTTGSRELLKIGESTRSTRLEDAHDLVFASEKRIYFIKSEDHRPCRLMTMEISSGESEELFYEQNEQFYLGLRLSKDKKYILLSGVSKTSSKIWVMKAGEEKRKKLVKLWQGSGKTYINHVEDGFMIWNNKDVSQIKLIKDRQVQGLLIKKESIDLSKMTGHTLYTSQPEESIEDIDLLKGKVILYGQQVTRPFIKAISYQKVADSFKSQVKQANLPFHYGTVSPCTNEDYNSSQIQFSVSTPFVYDEIYSYSTQKHNCKIIQKYEHTGPAILSDKFNVEIVDVPATDYNTIPLTIIGPKKRNPRKLLLNFYGCYGLPTKVPYDNVGIAALEKGWTLCHAHVRGGNEKGQKWHSQSQGDNRCRTWLDVEECVGYLLRERYTHPSLLFLSSSSAGAINLWNVIARKPYLYKGAIFRAPFLDVLSSLLDPNQPLSNTDYEEFGNPISNQKTYHQISAISPYENINPAEYPAIFIAAGLNDYRTPISQIAKFTSRFRNQSLPNSRLERVGMKGVTVDISTTGSHVGEASIKDENYRACDIFGYMDYVIDHCSKDCAPLN